MLKKYLNFHKLLRRNVSALYVTGDKAKENFAVMTPFLHFDERLGNFDEVQQNITRRKYKTNLDDLKIEYDLFKTVSDRKAAMEQRRDEIAKFSRDSPSEALKIEGKHLREDLKVLKENSYLLEDNFVHNYLNLPNFIHPNTPDGEKRVIYSFNEEAKNLEPKSKLDAIDELIEFYDSTCYFMKKEASKFDLFMPMHVINHHTEQGFINFSNPDFTRSVIAEGAGVDVNEMFKLKENEIENKLNHLHLTGNASFLSYLSFITKLSAFPTIFPLKFICTGKQYEARNHFDHQDLYSVVQATCCQNFITTAGASTFDEIWNAQIESFTKLYEPFGHHFRIVCNPAESLDRAESCRIGVEMFSPSANSYVEVGNFSYFGDYISKRLLFNYKIGKEFHFPHMYSGTVVNVMKLLLVLIENSEGFKCPSWLN